MPSIEPEPDPSGSVIRVGQDQARHWLVQEAQGRLEGRFISFAAAMAFARAERHGFPGCRVEVAPTPLTPSVPFTPVAPWEMASRRAA